MRIRKLAGLVGFIWAWLVMLPVQPVFAADFSNTVTTIVTINDFSERASVSMTMEVTNTTTAETPKVIDFAAVGKDVKNISAKFSDNSKGTTEYNAETDLISVTTSNSFKGKDKKWSVKLTYSTQAITDLGESKLALIPGNFSAGDQVEFTYEKRILKLDLGLGVATQLGTKAPETSLGIGQQILTWEENGPIDYATGVMFGAKALAEVKIDTTLENNGFWWKTFTVVLPPDTNQQRTVVTDITPKPTNVKVDIDGNILAEYRLRPFSSVDVSATANALVSNYAYALGEADETMNESDLSGLAGYLKTNSRWASVNTEITEEMNQLEKIDAIIAAVQDQVVLNEADELANSVKINDAFIGSLRANDIPARAIRGLVTDQYGESPRAWAEVYISGLGWITIDTSADTNSYRTADARYVALLLRGFSSDFPPSRVGDTSVEYIEGTDLPVSEEKPILSTKVYMVFPGIGLRVSNSTMPPGAIVDDVGLVYSDVGSVVKLGSIAPFQTASVKDFLFAGDAFSQSSAEYGVIQAGGGLAVSAESVSVVSWIPSIVLGVVLVLAILFLTYAKRRKKQGKKLFGKGMRRPQMVDTISPEKPEKLEKLPKIPTWRRSKVEPEKQQIAGPQVDMTPSDIEEPNSQEPEPASLPPTAAVDDMLPADKPPTPTVFIAQKEEPQPVNPDTDLSQQNPEDNQTKRSTNNTNSLIQ